jgi:hypothetical protein
VPVAYGHRDVWIKGFVDRVVIGCVAEIIAEHPRSYETGDMAFDPVHYLVVCDFHPNESNFVRDRHRAQIEASGFRF